MSKAKKRRQPPKIEKEETIDPEIRDVVTSLGKLIAASLAESTEGNSEKYGFCLLMFTQGDPSDVVLSISNGRPSRNV